MGFAENVKRRVRQRADMSCCICHEIGVQIHHIIPQGEDGPDDEDNAAPLCPSCHDTYGANPEKRKFVREARDCWYDICERRYASSADRLANLMQAISKTATKDDLTTFRSVLVTDLARMISSKEPLKVRRLTIGQVVSHLHDFRSVGATNGRPEADFLFKFIWGGRISDEVDEMKQEFCTFFGEETCRAICGYILQFHSMNLTDDGFTEPEISKLVSEAYCLMVFLRYHVEISRGDGVFVMGAEDDGELRAWHKKAL